MLSGGPLCSNMMQDFQSGLFLMFIVSETGEEAESLSDLPKW